MRRSKWLLDFVAAGAAVGVIASGCSSSSSKSPSEDLDSGSSSGSTSGSGGEAAASEPDSGGAAEAGEDAGTGVPMDCPDAGPVVLSDGGAGEAPISCNQCAQTMCASELAACATDCACSPGWTCLQQNNNTSSISTVCPSAMSAFFSDQGLINLEHCFVTSCNPPTCAAGD